jgi:hypothetical protein
MAVTAKSVRGFPQQRAPKKAPAINPIGNQSFTCGALASTFNVSENSDMPGSPLVETTDFLTTGARTSCNLAKTFGSKQYVGWYAALGSMLWNAAYST